MVAVNERTEMHRALEAIILVADEPVAPHLLAQLLELPVTRVEELCAELADSYAEAGHGFVLARIGGGYRFQTAPDLAPYVERFVLEGQSARLSAAAMETLAIVAYKQPLSRAQVAAIRGVNVDGVMRTLQQRGYIEEVARDPGRGQAVLFGTTRSFLEKLGLDSLDDLPSLGEFVPGADAVEALEHGLRLGLDEAVEAPTVQEGDEEVAAPDPLEATLEEGGDDAAPSA
jgi:segregation and condensation protein B